MLKLGYVGGLGRMAAPAARHLQSDGPAQVLRVHDRGRGGEWRDACRRDWRQHGAELVRSLSELVGDGDIDGVVVCCGKNGDDLAVVAELVSALGRSRREGPFLLHMSTVSTDFADTAFAFAQARGVRYVNYPLTGGPLGAERGGGHQDGMLILASGDEQSYRQLTPLLEVLGRPRYFGPATAAGAETKLMGQHMVFNGCVGISTAAALHAECFTGGVLGGEQQVEFFDFLNAGAGGTRQWPVALSKGIRDGVWDAGFAIHHAAVDAIYASQLAIAKQLPRISVQPVISIAAAFAFMMHCYPGQTLATHALVRELVAARARELDAFSSQCGAWHADPRVAVDHCVAALPETVRPTVGLDVDIEQFAAAAGE